MGCYGKAINLASFLERDPQESLAWLLRAVDIRHSGRRRHVKAPG